MLCPQCNVNMQTMKMGPVAMDECSRCGGIWFDQGELDQVIGTTDPDLRWLDIDFWKANSDFAVAPDSMGCPKCSRYYLTRLEDRATETSVALCGNCQGIWLDVDQLRAVIQAVSRCALRMDSADYVKESLHQIADMIGAATKKPLPISRWRDLNAVLRMLKYRIYSEHPKLVSMLVGVQKTLPV
ncbi:zf-TFIIB domain-containing protein [Desulfosarcina sp.]|uniref:zf-TFIIB domain-containing protein n=1 Tax=Desulfosarcina sp. TaxID=2027861 RepID=UPI003970F093